VFPEDLVAWLNANQHPGYAKYVAENRESIKQILFSLQIPLGSELAHLYLTYGSYPVRGWYELNEPESLQGWTEYAQTELGVPAEFIALSSIEGQGMTLFSKKTGGVFDVEYGQFEKLEAGELKPIAGSVVGFLYWCKERSDVGA
jgi:hypothetical protein